jgi:hypothetical protein
MSDGSTGSVSVTYSATGGTISAGGLYTAGTTTGSFQVIAAQQGGTLADTSSITITAAPPPPTLSQVILTPASASLQTGATQQFSVSGRMSDGSTSSVSVTYNATGGTITTGGLYTAGTTTGSFQVIAIQQGGTLADTSSVTITAAPPPGGGSGNITNCDFEAGNACGASPTSSSGTISFASSGCFAGTRCVDINVPASSSDGGSREDFDLGGARSDVWISFALKIITQPLSGLATQKMVIFRDVAASGANQFGEMNQIGGRWIWNWLFTDPNKGNIDLAAAPVGSWHTYKIHMTGNGFTLWMDGSSTPVKSLSTTAAVSGRPKQITLGGTLNGGSGASHFQFDNVHIGTSDPGWP